MARTGRKRRGSTVRGVLTYGLTRPLDGRGDGPVALRRLLQQVRNRTVPALGPEESDAPAWLARIVVGVRLAAITSVALLVALGPPWVRQHVGAVMVVLAVGFAYSIAMLVRPRLEIRRTRYTWLVTTVDSTVTLMIIALTGGASSPAVAILPLLVVSVSARSRAMVSVGIMAVIAAVYAVIALVPGRHDRGQLAPVLQATWWPPYLVMTTVLAAALAAVSEREQRSRILAVAAAEAERTSAEEERDLRARLLESYRSQQDGLRVLLHEFRTPLASLEALGTALADKSSPMSNSDRELTIRLENDHIRHLNEMLGGLGDVASSWRPTFSLGRVRGIDLRELIRAAADSVDLREPRLSVTIADDVDSVHADAQGLRRVLTNLLENASRHGWGQPVEVVCSTDGGELVISVLDRGPGVAPESLGMLTAKFVSVGDRRGTAGLGLWIVQQILDATGGRLLFAERPGGGLVATVRMPLASASIG